MKQTKQLKLFLIIFLAAFFGGSVPPFSKITLEVYPPFTILFLRFLLASIIMLPFVIRSKELGINHFKKNLLVAFIGVFNPLLYIIALQFTEAKVSPIIYASVPIMTTIYHLLIYKAKINKFQLAGIFVGFLGVILIILYPLIFNKEQTNMSFKGNLIIFLGAISFAIYGILSKKRLDSNSSPTALTFYMSLIITLIAIPLIFIFEHDLAFISGIELRHILSWLWVVIIGTCLLFVTYQYAIKFGNEITASLFTYLQPVTTFILSVILLGESITFPFIIGSIIALIGANLAVKKYNHT